MIVRTLSVTGHSKPPTRLPADLSPSVIPTTSPAGAAAACGDGDQTGWRSSRDQKGPSVLQPTWDGGGASCAARAQRLHANLRSDTFACARVKAAVRPTVYANPRQNVILDPGIVMKWAAHDFIC